MRLMLKKFLMNGVHEEHGLIAQFFGTYMDPYLKIVFSLQVKIDMN